MNNNDTSSAIADRIREANSNRAALAIHGGNSKAFYGNPCYGEALDVSSHKGITSYDPRELVITARAGTTLVELESALSEHRQILAFEPPRFSPASTLGGTIACGLAGPRRPYTGSARDFVLGINCINGRGEQLSFGGQVIKNVAGYDVSRLMTGAMGTLGVITEVSLKVLPLPELEVTLQKQATIKEYLATCGLLSQLPLPVSATCHLDNSMYIRLSGSQQSVVAAQQKLDGDSIDEDKAVQLWTQLRDMQHTFFDTDSPLWRLSLAADTLPLQLDGDWLLDWGGAQRWLKTNESADTIRALCDAQNGHATAYRNAGDTMYFHPLKQGIARIHKSLKQAFDPNGILNPGRLYKEF